MAHEAGKGSSPRPFSVSHEEWSTRWDVIFSRDKISKEIVEEQKAKQQSQHTQQPTNKETAN